MAVWKLLDKAEEDALMARVADLPMCDLIKPGVKVGECYVHHTNNCKSWLNDGALRPDFTPLVEPDAGCKYGHTSEKCKCRWEAVGVGQDETVAHSFDAPSSQWALDACSKLTKKGRVVASMVSAFKEMHERSFGIHISKTQFADYNANCVSRSLKPLDKLPGIRQISPGKNKYGFWTYENMAEQVTGVMDMMGFLHPDLQLVFLFY